MKKLIALVLISALAACAGATVSAETVTVDEEGGQKNVTATYTPGDSAEPFYSIDIDWGSLSFKYTAAGEGTWDPEFHTYTGGAAAKWAPAAADADKVKVTNHSNTAVDVELSFGAAGSFLGVVTGSFGDSAETLAEGQVGSPETAASFETTLTLAGNPTSWADTATVGTVTVSIQ